MSKVYFECLADAARNGPLRDGHHQAITWASDTITSQEAEIARLKEQQRWVAVSEKLPAPSIPVLTIHGKDRRSISVAWASFDGKTWYVGEWATDGITHWMPLPSPPTDNGDENG